MIAQTAQPRLWHGWSWNSSRFLSHSPILHSRAVPCQRRRRLPWVWWRSRCFATRHLRRSTQQAGKAYALSSRTGSAYVALSSSACRRSYISALW
jgi:hypothetical protein